MRRAITLALLVLAAPASAAPTAFTPEQEEEADRALRRDVERLVEVQEGGSWRIDRYEIEDMMPSALMTVCRIPKAIRAGVRARYDATIRALGGPLDAAWARTHDLSQLRRLIFWTRVRDLLAEADRRADSECPVWMEPEPGFHGYQSDAHRFTLNVETGGLAQLRRSGGHWSLGGGGVGRLLIGRGFERTSILFGAELAGGAMLRVGAEGFVINYFPALPFVFRVHDRTWHYDIELAPVALFQADDSAFSFGWRFGVGGGIQGRRTRGVIPWAGLSFAYEIYAPGARPAATFLRGGVRVGIVWG